MTAKAAVLGNITVSGNAGEMRAIGTYWRSTRAPPKRRQSMAVETGSITA